MDTTGLEADHEAATTRYRAAIEELNELRDKLIAARHIMDTAEGHFILDEEIVNGRNAEQRKAQLFNALEDYEPYQMALATRHQVENRIRTVEAERDIARSHMSLARGLIRAGVEHDD